MLIYWLRHCDIFDGGTDCSLVVYFILVSGLSVSIMV